MKIKIYEDGQTYVTNDRISIHPANIEPVEVIDLSDASEKEKDIIRKNPTNKKILKKYKNKLTK